MSLLKIDALPNFSRKLEKNKWADYIELLCLNSDDKEFSISDIMTYYEQEELTESSDSDEYHSEKDIKLQSDFLEIYKLIGSRKTFLDEFYPFDMIDKDTIKLFPIIDKKNLLYIYFLFSSNIGCFDDKTIPPIFTTSFEHISLFAMKLIYPKFKNELFGTASKKDDTFYGSSLCDRLEKLAKFLNTTLTQKTRDNPRHKKTSGDKGLDIVSFYAPDSSLYQASFIPVCVGQCSCSYDQWKVKQQSVKNSRLNNYFDDLAINHEYMFIPFPLRGVNGGWTVEDYSDIETIIIDRFRFISIFKLNAVDISSILTDFVKDKVKEFLEDLNVKVS
jgi:hypothetical protein